MWKLECSYKPSESDRNYISEKLENFYARTDLGFKNLERLEQSLKECQQHQSFFESKKEVVVIGLGGSSLGTKAFHGALLDAEQKKKIHFLDNVDAHTVDAFLESIEDVESVGWLLCSKSGSTIEVLTLFDYCSEVIKQKFNFEISNNCAAITEDKKSALHDFASAADIPILNIPLDIGGRFSVMTPVGLFPLSYVAVDIADVVAGFSAVLENKSLVAELSTQLYCSQKRDEFNLYSFQYSDRLSHWGLWLQQLWSESLGKAKKTDGTPAPVIGTFIPCRGASDQHSVLQQVIEGQEKKFVCFHRVESSEEGRYKISNSQLKNDLMINKKLGTLLKVEAEATEKAVQESGTETLVLKTEEINEKSLSYLMGLWMLVVGVLGEAFEIDAFNQPGVESGKVIARRVLSQPH